jgi:hypothetical protein
LAERRGHAPLKYNSKVAEQFGVQPSVDAPEAPRELVQVDHIPVPPTEEAAPARGKNPQMNPEERVLAILREEAEEISIRLERLGIVFGPAQQQELVDYGMAILSGLVGGGAIARRP